MSSKPLTLLEFNIKGTVLGLKIQVFHSVTLSRIINSTTFVEAPLSKSSVAIYLSTRCYTLQELALPHNNCEYLKSLLQNFDCYKFHFCCWIFINILRFELSILRVLSNNTVPWKAESLTIFMVVFLRPT